MTRLAARRILGAAALLLAVYVATLVFLFPAGVAWRAVEARLEFPVAVTVGSVSGRVWSGQIEGLRVDGHPVGSVRWRLMPTSLVGGRLGLALAWESGGDRVDGRVRVGTRSAKATDVRGQMGAERLQAWLDLPVLLDGRLTLDLRSLRWSAETGFADADGSLAWTGAGAGLPRPMRLGDYRAEISAAAGALAARIDTGPGAALAAEGDASWHPAGGYQVSLALMAAPEADRNLVMALDNIAQRQPDGSHWLQLPGGHGATGAPVHRSAPQRGTQRQEPATPADSDIFELP